MPANHPARTGKNYVQIWATPSGETLAGKGATYDFRF